VPLDRIIRAAKYLEVSSSFLLCFDPPGYEHVAEDCLEAALILSAWMQRERWREDFERLNCDSVRKGNISQEDAILVREALYEIYQKLHRPPIHPSEP